MNSPFYKQPWFIPVSVLIIIILWLQLMPTVHDNANKFKPDEIRQFVQVFYLIILINTTII